MPASAQMGVTSIMLVPALSSDLIAFERVIRFRGLNIVSIISAASAMKTEVVGSSSRTIIQMTRTAMGRTNSQLSLRASFT